MTYPHGDPYRQRSGEFNASVPAQLKVPAYLVKAVHIPESKADWANGGPEIALTFAVDEGVKYEGLRLRCHIYPHQAANPEKDQPSGMVRLAQALEALGVPVTAEDVCTETVEAALARAVRAKAMVWVKSSGNGRCYLLNARDGFETSAKERPVREHPSQMDTDPYLKAPIQDDLDVINAEVDAAVEESKKQKQEDIHDGIPF